MACLFNLCNRDFFFYFYILLSSWSGKVEKQIRTGPRGRISSGGETDWKKKRNNLNIRCQEALCGKCPLVDEVLIRASSGERVRDDGNIPGTDDRLLARNIEQIFWLMLSRMSCEAISLLLFFLFLFRLLFRRRRFFIFVLFQMIDTPIGLLLLWAESHTHTHAYII